MIIYDQGGLAWYYFCINIEDGLNIYTDPSPGNSTFSRIKEKEDPILIINLTKRK